MIMMFLEASGLGLFHKNGHQERK